MMREAILKAEARRARMNALGEKARFPGPQGYRAVAEWLRLHAEESAMSQESLEQAENQERLADDMEVNPATYMSKPQNMTDWQWFQSRNPVHTSTRSSGCG